MIEILTLVIETKIIIRRKNNLQFEFLQCADLCLVCVFMYVCLNMCVNMCLSPHVYKVYVQDAFMCASIHTPKQRQDEGKVILLFQGMWLLIKKKVPLNSLSTSQRKQSNSHFQSFPEEEWPLISFFIGTSIPSLQFMRNVLSVGSSMGSL